MGNVAVPRPLEMREIDPHEGSGGRVVEEVEEESDRCGAVDEDGEVLECGRGGEGFEGHVEGGPIDLARRGLFGLGWTEGEGFERGEGGEEVGRDDNVAASAAEAHQGEVADFGADELEEGKEGSEGMGRFDSEVEGREGGFARRDEVQEARRRRVPAPNGEGEVRKAERTWRGRGRWIVSVDESWSTLVKPSESVRSQKRKKRSADLRGLEGRKGPNGETGG